MTATASLGETAVVRAVFADGSSTDLTQSCAALIALGAQVAISTLGSVPIMAEVVEQKLGTSTGGEAFEMVLDLEVDDTYGRIELVDGDDAVFVLHHSSGDEVLSVHAALRLVALAAAALLQEPEQ